MKEIGFKLEIRLRNTLFTIPLGFQNVWFYLQFYISEKLALKEKQLFFV